LVTCSKDLFGEYFLGIYFKIKKVPNRRDFPIAFQKFKTYFFFLAAFFFGAAFFLAAFFFVAILFEFNV